MEGNNEKTPITLGKIIDLAKFGVSMPADVVAQLPIVFKEGSMEKEFEVDRLWLETAKEAVEAVKAQRNEEKQNYKSI
jgi:hypothetical protein